MRTYIIYLATSPSHKVYVGLTHKNLRTRKLQHIARARKGVRKGPFLVALRKYSYNFKWEILEDNLTLKQAEEREKFYIAKFNSINRKFGYNLSPGGLAGKVQSEEGEKRRQAKMAEHCKDPEYRKKLSASQKKRFENGEIVWNKGLTKEVSGGVASVGEQNKINSLGNKAHLGHRKQFCPKGHDTFITGRYKNSECIPCHKGVRNINKKR